MRTGASLLAASLALLCGAPAHGTEKTPSRSEGQWHYFIPNPLQYDKSELAEMRKAATARNIAILEGQVAEAKDRSAYLLERQSAAGVDLERRRWVLEQHRAAHETQFFYSHVVFTMANLIVLVGLALTIRQFTRDEIGWKAIFRHNLRVLRRQLSIRHEKEVVPATVPQESPETKIVLRSDGVEIGTRVTGLAILAISLGFYYLMLVHVYRINTTTSASAAASTASAASAAK